MREVGAGEVRETGANVVREAGAGGGERGRSFVEFTSTFATPAGLVDGRIRMTGAEDVVGMGLLFVSRC